MPTTLRNIDNAADAAISQYLDRYFYPFYTQQFQRFNDFENQMNGIDVRFDFKNLLGLLVDEKALTHYVNKNLPTFAFEIDFLSSAKQVIAGWLYDDHKLTQYYLLSWVTANKDKDFNMNNITSLDTLLVSRNALKKMLAANGIDSETAQTIAKTIRQHNQWGYFQKSYNNPCNFFFSNQLAEQPINIIVRKEKLIEIATARFTVLPR